MSYYARRYALHYYRKVKTLLEESGPLQSLLDVGCADTPVAQWGWFKERYTLDTQARPELEHVEAIQADWQTYVPDRRWSVITCLQVLEHMPRKESLRFASKILSHCDLAVFSVPYQWPEGSCKYHVQDPMAWADIQAHMFRNELLHFEIVSDLGRERAIWLIRGDYSSQEVTERHVP